MKMNLKALGILTFLINYIQQFANKSRNILEDSTQKAQPLEDPMDWGKECQGHSASLTAL